MTLYFAASAAVYAQVHGHEISIRALTALNNLILISLREEIDTGYMKYVGMEDIAERGIHM